MSKDHLAILILASILGFHAGLLAVRVWRLFLWRRNAASHTHDLTKNSTDSDKHTTTSDGT